MTRTQTRQRAPLCALLLLDMARTVHSYASLMTSTYCTTSLSAGTSMMGASAVSSTSSSDPTVSFDEASCGGTYTPGGSLTARIADQPSNWVMEVSGGSFDSGSCTGSVRTTTNPSTVTAPTDGSDLVLWAGSATGYGAVTISPTCTLTAGDPAPTAVPIPTPTAAPTTLPAPSPTAAPTTLPAPSPTAAPTTLPDPSPTASPTTLPAPAPTAGPGSPTSKPTTAPPSPAPSDLPTPAPTTSAPTSLPLPAPTVFPGDPTALPLPAPTVPPLASPTPTPTPAPSSAARLVVASSVELAGVTCAAFNSADVIAAFEEAIAATLEGVEAHHVTYATCASASGSRRLGLEGVDVTAVGVVVNGDGRVKRRGRGAPRRSKNRPADAAGRPRAAARFERADGPSRRLDDGAAASTIAFDIDVPASAFPSASSSADLAATLGASLDAAVSSGALTAELASAAPVGSELAGASATEAGATIASTDVPTPVPTMIFMNGSGRGGGPNVVLLAVLVVFAVLACGSGVSMGVKVHASESKIKEMVQRETSVIAIEDAYPRAALAGTKP